MAWPEQQVVDVADGVVALLQGRGEAGVSNAGLVIDGNAALVVDTFMFPEMANGLRRELDRRGAAPAIVLNTHHHIDHIGGNSVFGDATLVAHPRAVETIEQTGHPTAVYDGFMPAFRGRFAALDVVAPSPELDEADAPRDAQLWPFAPAHTPGDVAVWLPGERVLFTGDLCFFGVTPLALQGLLSAWIEAIEALLQLEPVAVVPGHGPIGGPDDMAAVADHLRRVADHGRAAVEAGASLDEALASFDAGPASDWIEAERTVVNLERAMQEARGDIDRDDVSELPASFARLLQP